MSEYSSLKATINANVKANNNHEITGSIMNSVLNAMIDSLGAGYQFMGMATPTNPGTAQTPDYKCFYLATTPGTYTNLGGLVVADGEVALLKYDTSWTKEVTGVATAAQVNQLGQEIKGIEVEEIGYLITSSNYWARGDTANSGALAEVTQGDSVAITAKQTSPAIYALLSSNAYADGVPAVFMTGETGRVVIPAGESRVVNIPENGWLYVLDHPSSGDSFPAALVYNITESIVDLIKKVEKRTAEEIEITEDALLGKIGNVQTPIETEKLRTDFQHSPYFIASNNLWSSSGTNSGGEFISVRQGQSVKIKANSTTNCVYAWLKNTIVGGEGTSPSYMDGYPSRIIIQNGSEIEIVAPASGYLYLTGTTTSAEFFPESVTFISHNDLQNQINNLEEVKELRNKKIAWFGDSICEGYGQLPYVTKYGWATPIQELYGAVCDNMGVSGATLRDKTNLGIANIPQILFSYENDADYYIISGGFNDRDGGADRVYWGTLDKNIYQEYGDNSLIYTISALEEICAYCQKNLSEKKYGFLICYDIADTLLDPQRWNELADLLVQTCEKWGMPYLDLRHCAGFNLCSAESRKNFSVLLTEYRDEYDPTQGYNADARVVYNHKVYKALQSISAPAGAFDESLWTQLSDDNGYDKGHCNRFAYDKMAIPIGKWLQTL